MGGFVGLVWDLLGYSMGGYESFKFTQSLISEVYSTTARSRMQRGNEPEDHDAAIEDLQKSLETKRRYEYLYSEYVFASILKSLCSCCCKKKEFYKKRQKRLKRHEAA